MPSSLHAQPSLSIPALDAFQLQLTPFNSTPTFACMERPLDGARLEACYAEFGCDVDKVTEHYAKAAGIDAKKKKADE